jgi:hypothetical protein
MLDEVNVYLYISDGACVTAFPTLRGENEYKGFTSSDEASHRWCRELFLHHWDRAERRTPSPSIEVKRSKPVKDTVSMSRTVVVGRERPELDAQAIQDAVDNYDEVVLRGRFNIGTSTVNINRSVVIHGEGREKDVPLTKLRRRGWQIPFTSNESLFLIEGEGIDVTIENIHFTDFNGICVSANEGGSLKLTDNRITLETGFARGRRHPYGDMVIGMVVGSWGGSEEGRKTFPRGVEISGNYLDFALSHLRGGYVSPNNEWDAPEYRPNLHDEYYIGVGIFIILAEGEVVIRDNVVRNMNTVGINIQDSYETAYFTISNNEVVSEIFGTHAHGWSDAGFGISVHSIFAFKDLPGYSVELTDNVIRCSKRNYSGINICGSFNTSSIAKLLEGRVSGNEVHLTDGAVGIKLGRNDDVLVSGNTISGKAYYGIRVHGVSTPDDREVFSEGNQVIDNDMSRLEIKQTDWYSNKHSDGITFEATGKTGHVWLDKHSRDNTVEVKPGETVIDEGEDNKVTVLG